MRIDGVNLTADCANCIVQGSLSRIVLSDGRLQLKGGIDPSIGCFVNAFTQLLKFRNTADNLILGITSVY